jgi:uncharacterized OB-fold protein
MVFSKIAAGRKRVDSRPVPVVPARAEVPKQLPRQRELAGQQWGRAVGFEGARCGATIHKPARACKDCFADL